MQTSAHTHLHVAGILKPVDCATPQMNSFVVVNKKQLDKYGKPQLCIYLDPSNLNKQQEDSHSVTAPEVIFYKASQVKVFIRLNFSKGYHSSESDEVSSF